MEILGLVDVPTWLVLLLAAIVLLYIYGTWTHSIWSSHGVPGPKPWPLLGNFHELMKMTQFRAYTEWGKKYGKVYGIYGFTPSLVVTDLDMLKEVLVKKFSNFVDRDIPREVGDETVGKGLFFVGGTAWKRIRKMMTPAFSTSKLKLMSHFIDRCSTLLEKNVDQQTQAGKNIDVKEVFGAYTMDVIAGTAFGLETNSQTQEEEPFVTNCKRILGSVHITPAVRAVFYIFVMFPFLGKMLRWTRLSLSSSKYAQFFIAVMYQMMEERQAEGRAHDKKTTDLLQMLLDAEADPEDIRDVADASDTTKAHRCLTKQEIVGQGFILFIAGFETTATTLQYLTYHMALYPDAQERVYGEIMDNIGQADPTYENVSTLKYLDAAIHETLRLFPPTPMINRRAQDTITIKDVTIPKGCGVIIPIHSIMHDPEHFHDPETFIPERFLGEKREQIEPMLVDLPFGYGPRQCIGMRLALLELKFAAVKIFRAYRFVKCSGTPEKINLGKAFGLAVSDVTIRVKAEPRAA